VRPYERRLVNRRINGFFLSHLLVCFVASLAGWRIGFA
jgi:hypothetical protein